MKPEAVPLGEACTVRMGQSPPGSSYNTSGDGLPFFQGKADFGDVYPKVRVFCNQPSRIANEGDILISVRAPVGPTNLARERCCIGRGLAALRAGTGLDTSFLLYFLRYYESRLASQGQGSTFGAINREDIEGIEIPLLSLSDQRRIGRRLEQADRLRRAKRYALELAETFLPAAFLEVFGDPFAGPSGQLMRLEDVLEGEPQNGLYVPTDRYVANDDRKGTEMVHMSDLFGGIVTPGNLKRALLDTSEITKYQLSECDLLVARRSLTYEGAAQPCRVPALRMPLVFESSMIRIKPDRGRVMAVYLYYYLTNRAVRENRVRRYVTISTISGINQDNLCRIEVVVPPLTLQEKFATLVERAECLQSVQREALRQAEHLFASLLHRAFRT